jgi:hypothetical protein
MPDWLDTRFVTVKYVALGAFPAFPAATAGEAISNKTKASLISVRIGISLEFAISTARRANRGFASPSEMDERQGGIIPNPCHLDFSRCVKTVHARSRPSS